MSDHKPVNRIPFEEIESATTWALPSLDDSEKIVPSVKKEPTKPAESPTLIEDVEQENIQPVTVEQLQAITEQAEREAREQGYQEGLAKGLEEGNIQGRKQGEQKAYAECKAELDEKIRVFTELANALYDPVAMQDNQLENWIIDSAVGLAKHLINRELIEDPSAVFHIIERAVACLPAGASHLKIFLHADDVELAHEAFAGNGQQWQFYVDPQLTRGGCRIESKHSVVDFSIERRLQSMLEEVNFRGDVDDELPDTIPSYEPVVDSTTNSSENNTSDNQDKDGAVVQDGSEVNSQSPTATLDLENNANSKVESHSDLESEISDDLEDPALKQQPTPVSNSSEDSINE